MQKYTGICREINTAHSMAQKENAAIFKHFKAQTETLTKQQTALFADEELHQEAFYRQELNAREKKLAKNKQRAAAKRAKAKARIKQLRIENA